MSYILAGINSSQELFESLDKMRELTVKSTSTTKLELAYDEVQHAITALNNEITEEDEKFLIYDEVVALHNLADAIKARIDFANKEAEDDGMDEDDYDDEYYDDLNDDSDYDEDDIDDLYIELKERGDLISKLQTKIANLEKVAEDTRKVDDSIKREHKEASDDYQDAFDHIKEDLKKHANPWEHAVDLDNISAYLTGDTNNIDKELENNLKQAADLLSSFEDHLRRR